MKVFKGKWKFSSLKIVIQTATSINSPNSKTLNFFWGEIEVQSFEKSTYFRFFQIIFILNNVKFSQKNLFNLWPEIFKAQRFSGIWKWSKDKEKDGSLDRTFEASKIFGASLQHRSRYFNKIERTPTLVWKKHLKEHIFKNFWSNNH